MNYFNEFHREGKYIMKELNELIWRAEKFILRCKTVEMIILILSCNASTMRIKEVLLIEIKWQLSNLQNIPLDVKFFDFNFISNLSASRCFLEQQ